MVCECPEVNTGFQCGGGRGNQVCEWGRGRSLSGVWAPMGRGFIACKRQPYVAGSELEDPASLPIHAVLLLFWITWVGGKGPPSHGTQLRKAKPSLSPPVVPFPGLAGDLAKDSRSLSSSHEHQTYLAQAETTDCASLPGLVPP